MSLRVEIERLLGDALKREERHDADTVRRDQRHIADTERRDQMYIAETERRNEMHEIELLRREEVHAHEVDGIRAALETRDTIGQAKGIIMATMGCSADEAFALIRTQSQHENRKLADVAIDIVHHVSHRPPSAL